MWKRGTLEVRVTQCEKPPAVLGFGTGSLGPWVVSRSCKDEMNSEHSLADVSIYPRKPIQTSEL